jgi:hypothetical protein
LIAAGSRVALSPTVRDILARLRPIAVGMGLAVSQADCSSPGAATPAPDTAGFVSMRLTLPNGEQINSATWSVTGPGGASTVVQTGMVAVGDSGVIGFGVGGPGLTAGSDYYVAVTGYSADELASCVGGTEFTAAASHAVTNVSVSLTCSTAASEAGSALFMAHTFICATVTSVSASPAEVNVGHSIALTSTASGPNPGSVTYLWSASPPSGSFDSQTAQDPNFTCGATGPVTLTLTVSDGSVPEGGVCNSTLDTSSVQVMCDAAPQGDM